MGIKKLLPKSNEKFQTTKTKSEGFAVENNRQSLLSRIKSEIQPVVFEPTWIVADSLQGTSDGDWVTKKYSGWSVEDICSNKIQISDSDPYVFSGQMSIVVLPVILAAIAQRESQYLELLTNIAIALTFDKFADLREAVNALGSEIVSRRLKLLHEVVSGNEYYAGDRALRHLFRAQRFLP